MADAFVVAMRRPEVLPDEDADVWPWLVATVRRLAANQRRRRVTRQRHWADTLREGWQVTSVGSPEEALAQREECLNALAALSDADRELILLIAWDGLTPAQAAEVLGIRRNALVVRLHRARRRLTGEPSRPTTPLLAAVSTED